MYKGFVYSSSTGFQKRYFDWIRPMAKEVSLKYGIPYTAIMVQTALETGYGKSSLLTKYNNFGGIKSVKGDSSVTMGTKEFINGVMVTISDGFATWKSPLQGLEGYGNFFHRNKRYASALKEKSGYDFINAIWKAGYATDPNYMSKIGWMYTTYKKYL